MNTPEYKLPAFLKTLLFFGLPPDTNTISVEPKAVQPV